MQQPPPAKRSWSLRTGSGLPVLLVALGMHMPAAAKVKLHSGKAVAVASLERREPPRLLADQSEDKIIAIAEKRYHAKVVRVEEGNHQGRRVYVLRLLSKEGRVWTVKVDAETGGEM